MAVELRSEADLELLKQADGLLSRAQTLANGDQPHLYQALDKCDEAAMVGALPGDENFIPRVFTHLLN